MDYSSDPFEVDGIFDLEVSFLISAPGLLMDGDPYSAG